MGNEVFISNNSNLVSSVTSSSIKPAYNSSKRVINSKGGNGSVVLSGGYTGTEDATFDIEIDSNSALSPQVSDYIISGVGNGTLESVSADSGATVQSIEITVRSTGTLDRQAVVDIIGAIIKAKIPAPFVNGNDISISVDDSGLVFSDTSFSLLDPIQEGKAEYTGTQYNFGALALTVDGEIDAETRRISFYGFPGVYRQHREIVNGQYVFVLTPTPTYTIPAGTKILDVTGSVTVTVSDGVTDEVFTGIITNYDFLSQLDTSTLVDVESVVADDRKPNGDGVVDFGVKTASYRLPTQKSGGAYLSEIDLEDVVIAPLCPTQSIEIECTNNDQANDETWKVTASVDGQSEAITGTLLTRPNFAFRIPEIELEATDGITAVFSPVTRDASEVLPSVCINHLEALKKAVNGTYTYVYTQRNTASCQKCNPSAGSPASGACAGKDGGTEGVIPVTQQVRQGLLSQWLAGFVDDSVDMRSNPTTGKSEILSHDNDITVAQEAYNVLLNALNTLHDGTGVISFTAWSTSLDVEIGDAIQPTVDNEHFYRALNAGTTDGSTEPVWVTDGTTVTDNGIVWQDMGKRPLDEWDDLFQIVQDDLAQLHDTDNTVEWEAGRIFRPKTILGYIGGAALNVLADPNFSETIVDTGANGHGYKLAIDMSQIDYANSGMSPGDYARIKIQAGFTPEAIIKIVSAIASDDIPPYTTEEVYAGIDVVFTNNTDTGIGTVIGINYNGVYIPSVESEASEPTFNTDGTNSFDGTEFAEKGIYWVDTGLVSVNPKLAFLESATTTQIIQFVNQYSKAADRILSNAQIALSPKVSASTQQEASECWQDEPEAFWWEESTGLRLPAFTNKKYYSVKRDNNGRIVPTFEFYFYINVSENCEGSLKEGDKVIITIDGAKKGYQVGDKLTIPVIHAEPIYLTGGQDGDNTITCGVKGSVDGVLPDYSVIRGAEADYNQDFLHFTLYDGAIPFVAGDKIIFSVEGGTFQWRKNGGGWTTGVPVDESPTLLSDGVSVEFLRGSTPSNVIGDSYTFKVKQPYRVSNLLTPESFAHKGDGTGLTVTADLGSIKEFDSVVTRLPNLEDTATVSIDISDDALTWVSYPVSIDNPTIAIYGDYSGRYVRVVVASSDDVEIEWLWIGESFSASTCPDIELFNSFLMTDGSITSQHIADGHGAIVNYRHLQTADMSAIMAMIKYSKTNNDQAICFIPNKNNPEEAMLVRFASNDFSTTDFRRYGSVKSGRLESLSLALNPRLR